MTLYWVTYFCNHTHTNNDLLKIFINGLGLFASHGFNHWLIHNRQWLHFVISFELYTEDLLAQNSRNCFETTLIS